MVFARGPSVRSHDVGVDDADCGHESEHRRGSNEAEPARLQVGSQGTRFGQSCGNLDRTGRMRVGIGTIRPHERSQVGGVGGVGLVHVTQSERGPRIRDRSLDLAAVADNGGV